DIMMPRLDGYQTEFVVDTEQYIVRVPAELSSIGVLCEPLSVAEKAIEEAVKVQEARLPDAPATPAWLHGRRCLVAGMGPIGLLAALALRRSGKPLVPCILLGLSFILVFHSPPVGPIGMLLFLLAVVGIERAGSPVVMNGENENRPSSYSRNWEITEDYNEP
ncbi:MAG: hypothetical protein P8X95_09740, partial [Anaerolineales bacterium]